MDLQDANETDTSGSALLLHSGNVIITPVLAVVVEDPCIDRVSNAHIFGAITVDADLIDAQYEDELQAGDYIVTYDPSTLDELTFRVREIENTGTDTVIHVVECGMGSLTDVAVDHMAVIGLIVEESETLSCRASTPVKTVRIRTDSARLVFTTPLGVELYRVRYKETADNDWTEVDALQSVDYVDLSGLTSKTEYEWQVMGYCSYPDQFTQFSQSLIFTTR